MCVFFIWAIILGKRFYLSSSPPIHCEIEVIHDRFTANRNPCCLMWQKVLGPSVQDIRMNFVKCSALNGVYHDKHM